MKRLSVGECAQSFCGVSASWVIVFLVVFSFLCFITHREFFARSDALHRCSRIPSSPPPPDVSTNQLTSHKGSIEPGAPVLKQAFSSASSRFSCYPNSFIESHRLYQAALHLMKMKSRFVG